MMYIHIHVCTYMYRAAHQTILLCITQLFITSRNLCVANGAVLNYTGADIIMWNLGPQPR